MSGAIKEKEKRKDGSLDNNHQQDGQGVVKKMLHIVRVINFAAKGTDRQGSKGRIKIPLSERGNYSRDVQGKL